jgi:hypothetical protein
MHTASIALFASFALNSFSCRPEPPATAAPPPSPAAALPPSSEPARQLPALVVAFDAYDRSVRGLQWKGESWVPPCHEGRWSLLARSLARALPDGREWTRTDLTGHEQVTRAPKLETSIWFSGSDHSVRFGMERQEGMITNPERLLQGTYNTPYLLIGRNVDPLGTRSLSDLMKLAESFSTAPPDRPGADPGVVANVNIDGRIWRYTLWLDREHGYAPRRIDLDVTIQGEPTLPPGRGIRIENFAFTQVAGVWIPSQGAVTYYIVWLANDEEVAKDVADRAACREMACAGTGLPESVDREALRGIVERQWSVERFGRDLEYISVPTGLSKDANGPWCPSVFIGEDYAAVEGDETLPESMIVPADALLFDGFLGQFRRGWSPLRPPLIPWDGRPATAPDSRRPEQKKEAQ